jgi:hypothetical protein
MGNSITSGNTPADGAAKLWTAERVSALVRKALPGAKVRTFPGARRRLPAVDFVVSVTFRGATFDLIIDVAAASSSPLLAEKVQKLKLAVAQVDGGVPMIVGDRLGPSHLLRVRGAGVSYIGADGTVHIDHGPILIDRVASPGVSGHARRLPQSPFKDKASLVLRALLSEDREWGVREVSGLVGVSPGYVAKVLERATELGYVVRGPVGSARVRDPLTLLADWVHSYDSRRNRMEGFFCVARDPGDILQNLVETGLGDDSGLALTAQAAASLVAPYAAFDRVDLYVAGDDARTAVVGALSLREASQGANVILWTPYYKHSVLFGSRQIGGLRVVSDEQLYLDLAKYPLRIEAAEHLLQTRLQPRFAEWGRRT